MPSRGRVHKKERLRPSCPTIREIGPALPSPGASQSDESIPRFPHQPDFGPAAQHLASSILVIESASRFCVVDITEVMVTHAVAHGIITVVAAQPPLRPNTGKETVFDPGAATSTIREPGFDLILCVTASTATLSKQPFHRPRCFSSIFTPGLLFTDPLTAKCRRASVSISRSRSALQ